MAIKAVHVDADGAVLDETMPTLETNDVAVTPAASAAEALSLLDDDVDCVIAGTDVGDLDVIDFLGQVRNEQPDLPFVIYADTWDIGRTSTAVTAGVTDLVFREHEPNPELALVSRVHAAVERRERRRVGDSTAVEERYRRLVESAPAPIVIYDGDGTIVYANEAAARFANADAPTSLVGLDVLTFVPEEERDWVEDRIERVLDQRETVPQTELEFRAIDDEPLYAIDVSAPIEYRGEEAGQTVLHDVSALKRREEELAEHRGRLQRIIDNIPGMVYRCSTEAPWPMEYVGGQVEDLTGHTADQIESGEVLWGEDVIVGSLDEIDAAVRDAIERDDSFEVSYRIQTADGTIKHVWEQGEPVHEDGDTVLEGVIMDVTAQRAKQRELEHHEAYREDLYEIANDEDLVPMERVEEMLRLGSERFDVELGFLASIDRERDRHEIVAIHGDHEVLRRGAVATLDQTYCRRVLESDDVLGVNDAVNEGWEDDPAYIEYGLGCYIGAEVHVDGGLYGTICFADEEPRSEPFGDVDKMFVELLARAVGHELMLGGETVGAD